MIETEKPNVPYTKKAQAYVASYQLKRDMPCAEDGCRTKVIAPKVVWTKPYQVRTRTWRRILKGISEVGPFTGEPEEWICTVSITRLNPDTNTYIDKDPEEMVKMLDRLGRYREGLLNWIQI